MDKDLINKQRFLLKTTVRKDLDLSLSDQNKGVPMPELEKMVKDSDTIIPLMTTEDFSDLANISVLDALLKRETKRKYSSKEPMSFKELSFLLYFTQGVRLKQKDRVLRTVPSAGNRHPFDTYIAVFNVEGLEKAIYRYLPLSHSLVLHKKVDDLEDKLNNGCNKQVFVSRGAVTFIWVAVPYRSEWRYMSFAPKSIIQDSGHLCQNLYIACEGIGYGTCAIGAYDQELMDDLLGLDGEDEFTIYIAPVGK